MALSDPSRYGNPETAVRIAAFSASAVSTLLLPSFHQLYAALVD